MNSSKNNPQVSTPLILKNNKIFFDTLPINKRFQTVGIIVNIIFIVFIIMLYKTLPDPDFIIIICIPAVIILDSYFFGTNYKYVFNLRNNKIMLEGSLFFIPFSINICDFADIAVLGITGYSQGRGRYSNSKDYFYYLVFASKQKPKKFIKLISNYESMNCLSLADINSAGHQLSNLLDIHFVFGNVEKSLKAVKKQDGISYELGPIYDSFIEEWWANRKK